MKRPLTPPPPETVRAHVAAFDGLLERLPGSRDRDLARLRADALTRFAEDGLPTRRIEEWKFTGLDGLTRAVFAPTAAAAAITLSRDDVRPLAPAADATTLVFVNGTLDPDLSDAPPPGVATLPAALDAPGTPLSRHFSTGTGRGQSLVALNTAFMAGGAVIDLAAGATLDRPLVLVFIAGGDGVAVHTRNLIRLGTDVRARVIEIHASVPGAGATFSNAVTDIEIGANATLHHARIAAEGEKAFHHAHAAVSVGKGAAYTSFALSVGGELTRQESDVRYTAEGGRVRLFGAYLGRGRQHMDHTTRVWHDHPGCTTEELFKGALDDHAHGVFQGLIRVAPHAVRTDAQQKNTNLLLSDRAVADTKPELEILADDVKCSHGATVGDLDEDEIFYLRARGLTGDESRRLLLAGYLEDLIARLDDDAIGSVVRTYTGSWLGAGAPEETQP
ncbi:MAG: Fe-S cluster assembly protein SufD [Alphaproteobacteria bacterium]